MTQQQPVHAVFTVIVITARLSPVASKAPGISCRTVKSAGCQYLLTLLETMMQFGHFDSRSLYLFPLPRQKPKFS